jgi:adhesin transport system membrane fusion protein
MSFTLTWLTELAQNSPDSQHSLRKARRLTQGAAVLLVLGVIWSTLAPMDKVVRSNGRIVAADGAQLVQHLEGGILSALTVREGQLVQQGQEVAALADVMAESSRDQKRGRIELLRARIARLKAEANDGNFVRPEGTNEEAWASERDLFASRISKLRQSVAVVAEQAEQKRAEIAENQSRLKGALIEMEVAREQFTMVQNLLQRGAASQMEALDGRARMERLQSQVREAETALPRLRASLREAEGRMAELRAQAHSEARTQLAESTSELEQLTQEDKIQADRLQRTVVRSPITGTVNRILTQTLGGVVRPGDTLMEITPTQSEVLVEGNVSPNDRAELRVGLPVVVRVGAYDYSVYGSLRGQVKDISPDTVANERGERFFRLKIIVPAEAHARFGHALSPGMSATVDVKVGQHTVFHYLVKPLRQAMDQASKDRV